jgi:1,2-dihydroxy-3-keto-5-methylthiopentene dioxygenase
MSLEQDYPMAPDGEWPEAWIMPDEIPEGSDQCLPNRLTPNHPVTVADLKDIGISFWKLDADTYEYPIKAIPWDPQDALDPKLKALRDARGYSYADIITIHPDHLPEFDMKIKAFFEEVRCMR